MPALAKALASAEKAFDSSVHPGVSARGLEIDDKILSLEIRQGDGSAAVARQAERGGLGSGGELGRHMPSFRLFRTVILGWPQGLGGAPAGQGFSPKSLTVLGDASRPVAPLRQTGGDADPA